MSPVLPGCLGAWAVVVEVTEHDQDRCIAAGVEGLSWQLWGAETASVRGKGGWRGCRHRRVFYDNYGCFMTPRRERIAAGKIGRAAEFSPPPRCGQAGERIQGCSQWLDQSRSYLHPRRTILGEVQGVLKGWHDLPGSHWGD